MGSGKIIVSAAVGLIGLASSANAANLILNSFENTLNGYTNSGGNPSLSATPGFSTTTGVTDGQYSLAVGVTAAPTYGQYIQSPYSTANTTTLASASSINFDVFTPANYSGGYLQFKVALQTNAAGFPYYDLGGFDATHSAVFGSETTLSFPIPASLQATLTANSLAGNTTDIIIAVGGGAPTAAGGDTFYLDNLTATSTVSTPEPASLGLLALAAPALIRRRRA